MGFAILGHNWYCKVLPWWSEKFLPRLFPKSFINPSTTKLALGNWLLDVTAGEVWMNFVILTAFGFMDTFDIAKAIKHTN